MGIKPLTMPVSAEDIRRFRSVIRAYFRENRRSMPWRDTHDPFAIVVSEIMLQQTQVDRVREKYTAFIERFPDFRSLAEAPLAEVLTLWQGLGYNRRAIALKGIAAIVSDDFGSLLPNSVEVLKRLPGIGHATASSIAAFAFNAPAVFVETNIRRVFIHHFFHDRTDVHDDEIMPLVERTLDRKNPREWYYALMDYGASLKKSVPNPNRRSRHYARQAKFEGSTRQKRGAILRFVLMHAGCTERAISTHLSLSSEQIRPLLSRMLAEGLLTVIKKRYSVV